MDAVFGATMLYITNSSPIRQAGLRRPALGEAGIDIAAFHIAAFHVGREAEETHPLRPSPPHPVSAR